MALLAGISTIYGTVASAQEFASNPERSVQLAASLGSKPGEIEEITVTARHRTENNQKVPIPITVLTEAQLSLNPDQRNLHEIQQQIPSLNIQGYSPRNQTITIRGLGTTSGSTNDGLEQGVGVYIDGVYYARTGTAVLGLPAIDSINVLRGPQGTLFGKNTVAGAVDIRTKLPSFDPLASGEISYGNYDYYSGLITLDTPVGDTLAAKFIVSKTRRSGFIHDTVYDSDWDNTAETLARLDLLYKPDDDFSYRLIADTDYEIGNQGFEFVNSLLPLIRYDGKLVSPLGGFSQRAASIGYNPVPAAPFGRITDLDSSQYDRTVSDGISGTGTWDIGPFTLTSISAYRKFNYLPNFDGDQTGAPLLREGVVITHQQQASQELRLSSRGGNIIDYTGGLYYFWQRADDTQQTSYLPAYGTWVYGPRGPLADPRIYNGLNAYATVIPRTYSYAAYAQATWHVLPTLAVTGGLRYTYEDKTGVYNSYQTVDTGGTPTAALGAAGQANRAALAPIYAYNAHTYDKKPSGTLNVSYDFAPDMMVYATFSRGYKSAGINLIAPTPGVNVFVAPEKVNDYELGVKMSFFDRHLTLNANLFWEIDDDYQANILVQNPVNGKYVAYIGNVGKVRTRGVELDARAVPLSGLSITFSGSFDDATYLSYPNASCPYMLSYNAGACNLNGKAFAGVPRFSLTGGIEYAKPLGLKVGTDVEGYVGGDWHLQSHFFSAVNSDPLSIVPAYQLVDIHAGIRPEDGPWDAEIWVRNLFNANYLNNVNVSTLTYATTAEVGEPRLFGVTLRYHFL